MIDEAYMEALILEDTKMTAFKKYYKSSGWIVRKLIKGYGRKYMISRNGLVFNRDTNRWLKPQTHKNGYLYVCLYHEGKRKNVYLHRLVAEYFVPNPNGFDVAYHLDGDKSNNRARNLGWISKSLLQREFDPDNLPLMVKGLKKPTKRKTVRSREIPDHVRRSLERMAEIGRRLPPRSEERADFEWLLRSFWEDARKGIRIPK